MIDSNRRLILAGAGAGLALSLAGCNSTGQKTADLQTPPGRKPKPGEAVPENVRTAAVPAGPDRYQALYSGADGEKFSVPALKQGTIPEAFWRADVPFLSSEPAG